MTKHYSHDSTDRVLLAIAIIESAIKERISLSAAIKKAGKSENFIRAVKRDCEKHPKFGEFIKALDKFHSHLRTKESDKKSDEDNLPSGKSFSEKNDGTATHTYKGSKRITSLDDAINFFKIDTDLWEVTNYICNSYDVSARVREQDLSWKEGVMTGSSKRENKWTTETNYQVKVWLRKRQAVADAFDHGKFFQDLLKKHKPVPYKPVKYKKTSSGNLLELNIFDAHIGKLCWANETNENYDLKIASKRFRYVLHTLVNRASSYDIDRIVFPIGNDFFNSDNHIGTTTAGTRQDEDGRWQKVFRIGCELLIEAIDLLRQIAPVDVIVVPGNHDYTKSVFLGEYLYAWYRTDNSVNVNNSINPRKYYEFGKVLIGYTHGDREKQEALRSLMAYEAKEAWARCTYKEFHLGHQHRKLSVKYTVKSDLLHEELGIVIRSMSSIAGTDAWHHAHGYTGPVKAAEALIWNSEEGLVGTCNANITF